MLLVYTTVSCKYCRLLLDVLTSAHETYYQILCEEEQQFTDIQRRCGKRTLPQVMLGDTYVGGYRIIADLAERGVLKDTLRQIREQCSQQRSQSNFELPVGATRLTFPDDDGPRSSVTPTTGVEREITIAGDEIVDDLDAQGRPEHIYWECRKQHVWRFRRTGAKRHIAVAKIITGIGQINAAISHDEATEIAARLFELGYFKLADKSVRVQTRLDAQKLRQVIKGHQRQFASCVALRNPMTLNMHRVYRSELPVASASTMSEQIRASMSKLYDRFISKDGVAYDALRHSPEYLDFLEQIIVLQKCDMSVLDNSELTAFFLNIYNAMVVHANVVFGPPTNPIQRKRFFGGVGYNIGGLKWSLDDIEHGALRCNPPAGLFGRRRFKAGDRRLQFVLKELDPRIHFALVCGAKSCPPVQVYNSSIIDKALQWAAEGFLEEDVQCDLENNTVTISKIMYWYQRDFGSNPHEILKWVAEYLPHTHPLHNQLSLKPSVIYAKYDWSLNNRDLDDEIGLSEIEESDIEFDRTDTSFSLAQLDESSAEVVSVSPFGSPRGKVMHRSRENRLGEKSYLK